MKDENKGRIIIVLINFAFLVTGFFIGMGVHNMKFNTLPIYALPIMDSLLIMFPFLMFIIGFFFGMRIPNCNCDR